MRKIEQFLVSYLLFWGEAHEIIKRLRMFHAQPFDYFSCITFKESPLGAEHAFRIQRASFFNEIESEMLSLTIKFSKFFEYRSDYVKNKQIADEFDPTFKNKQCRRIRPFLRHETKRVEFVGMPTNSPPLRDYRQFSSLWNFSESSSGVCVCFL